MHGYKATKSAKRCMVMNLLDPLLPQGGGGGGGHPPNFGLQYKGVSKSPLLSLFCNSVFWVNSRPPNLAVLPPGPPALPAPG